MLPGQAGPQVPGVIDHARSDSRHQLPLLVPHNTPGGGGDGGWGKASTKVVCSPSFHFFYCRDIIDQPDIVVIACIKKTSKIFVDVKIPIRTDKHSYSNLKWQPLFGVFQSYFSRMCVPGGEKLPLYLPMFLYDCFLFSWEFSVADFLTTPAFGLSVNVFLNSPAAAWVTPLHSNCFRSHSTNIWTKYFLVNQIFSRDRGPRSLIRSYHQRQQILTKAGKLYKVCTVSTGVCTNLSRFVHPPQLQHLIKCFNVGGQDLPGLIN